MSSVETKSSKKRAAEAAVDKASGEPSEKKRKLEQKADLEPAESTTDASESSVAAAPPAPAAKTTVVRLRRQGGEVVQDCDVYIGRALNMGGWRLKESKWHNPFTVKACKTAQVACEKFKAYLLANKELMAALPELKGKVLGCWCKNKPSDHCHGDILAELANAL